MDRERKTDRQTGKQISRKGDIQMEREGQTDKQIDRHQQGERYTDGEGGVAARQTDKPTTAERKIHRWRERERGRQTNR